jgi:hypothetical protein
MSIKFTTETINTYDNDSAKWHLACLPSTSYSQVVVRPFGPVKVKTLPVLASKVLVSKLTTTISGFPPKTTYFNALNQKVKEQHTKLKR